MNNLIIVYHGSDNIIKEPKYGLGRVHKDYGQGFYTTENEELGKEWACYDNLKDGFLNTYLLDLNNLNILDLRDEKYNVLNWFAILLKYRYIDLNNTISNETKKYIIKNYYIDISNYDIIIGYRADDSYFKIVKDFLKNSITLRQFNKAIMLGNLGHQIVLISKKSFKQIHFLNVESINSSIYYTKRKARNINAVNQYYDIQTNTKLSKKDLFMVDIIRKGLKNDEIRKYL